MHLFLALRKAARPCPPLIFTLGITALPFILRSIMCTQPIQFLHDWDDGVNYVFNPLFRHASNTTAVLTILSDVWDISASGVVLGVWEPVALSIKIIFAFLLSSSRAPAFSAFASCIHVANTVLLQTLTANFLLRVLKRQRHVCSASWAAALASALWSVHPHRTEATGWLSCLPYLLAGLFALFSTLCYLLVASKCCSRIWSAILNVLVRVFYAAAALCKAPALALPLAFLPLDVTIFFFKGEKGEILARNKTRFQRIVDYLSLVTTTILKNADLLLIMIGFAAWAHIANTVNNSQFGGNTDTIVVESNEDWWKKIHENQYLWSGELLNWKIIVLKAFASSSWYMSRIIWPYGLAMICEIA